MKSTEKWFNNEALVGMLLLFLPPVGLYALFYNTTIKQVFKNVIYAAFVVVGIFFIYKYVIAT